MTAVLLLAACSSSPTPTLYTLAPVPGAQHATKLRTVVLRSISLARYLEREQIVLSTVGYQLELQSNDWWGEPLGAMLNRVLVEELSQRLPGTSVLAEMGAISITPDATIEVNILRMDADHDGTVVLRAQFGISRQRGEGTSQSAEIRATPPSGDIRGTVAAMSDAVGQLADKIAAALPAR